MRPVMAEFGVCVGAGADLGAAVSDIARESFHIFIAAAGKINDNELVLVHLGRAADELSDGVRGFERGNNAFDVRQSFGGVDRVVVGHGGVFGAPKIGEPGVFRANGRIIEASGDRMRGGDLAVVRLQNVAVGTLQNTGTRAAESTGGSQADSVLAESVSASAGFNADHFYGSIGEEGVEKDRKSVV